VSWSLLAAAWASDTPHIDRFVLVALADWADETGRCWPSLPRIAGKTGLDVRTIRRAIGRLVAAGHMSREERSGKGVVYTVHPGHCDPGQADPGQADPRSGSSLTPVTVTPNTLRTTIPQKASPSSVGARLEMRAEAAIEIWNAMADRTGLPKALAATGKRLALLKKRLAEHGEEGFRVAVEAVERSPFCRGENQRGWRADIGFLLRPDNFQKLIEGGYDAPGSAKPRRVDTPMTPDQIQNAIRFNEDQGNPARVAELRAMLASVTRSLAA